jgi:hypothetical protein
MLMFIVGNPDLYHTSYILHGINKCLYQIYKNKLHIPSMKLSAIQKGVLYSSVKVFNTLPSNIADLQNKNQVSE